MRPYTNMRREGVMADPNLNMWWAIFLFVQVWGISYAEHVEIISVTLALQRT